MPLGDFKDNVGHSNVRFGLRVFVLAARRYPCEDAKNPFAPDIWIDNPSFTITYADFTAYKN